MIGYTVGFGVKPQGEHVSKINEVMARANLENKIRVVLATAKTESEAEMEILRACESPGATIVIIQFDRVGMGTRLYNHCAVNHPFFGLITVCISRHRLSLLAQ